MKKIFWKNDFAKQKMLFESVKRFGVRFDLVYKV